MVQAQDDRPTPHQSLATRLSLLVLASTVVTAVIVTLTSVQSTYSFLRRNIDENFPTALERSNERLTGWLEEGRARAEELARKAQLHAALARTRPTTPLGGELDQLDSLLRDELALGRLFSSLVVLDVEGRIRTAIGTDAAPADATVRELAEIESARIHTIERRTGALPVASAPLLGADGRALGSVHGFFRLEGIAAQLRSDLLGTSGDVYLVDGAGRVLAAGRPFGPGSGSEPVPLEALLGDPAPQVRSFEFADGQRAIGIARRLDPLGWNLVIHQPFGEAFAPMYSVVTRILLIDAVIILLFSIVAYKITSAVMRPIGALYEGARRISQGELDVQLPESQARDEVGLLTRTFNDMTERLRKDRSEIEVAYKRVQEQSDELQRANEVLEQLSITDGLTRLHNHRYFQEHLTREIKRVSRTSEPLSMLVIDIDDFKRLNDRLGHAAGDELLLRIARTLNESVRASDLLARYGGEEFVVLAPGTDITGAVNLAEKVRTAVAESSFILDDSMRLTRASVSIGVAQYDGSRRDFFESADRALYRAKAAGKNCVMAAEDGA
jgi:diguanylate cyclase (GGDEF)-like protein